MKLFLAFLLGILTAAALAVTATAGPYRLEITTDPAIIPVGRANLLIVVRGADGAPVPDLEVKTFARMPTMKMGEKEETATEGAKAGDYVSPAVFSMAGGYDVTVKLTGPAGTGEATVSLSTGQNTQGGGPSGPSAFLPWLAVLAVGAFVVYRLRKTGQRIDPKSILNRSVMGSLFLLVAVYFVADWVVRTQRRPGAMTPIESQAMEMNTPAPGGALPVRLATAERRAFAATVRYTGQAVGFLEQDVIPRVGGTLVWMPLYVGDPVKRGQLLARLDPSQLDPEVAMKSAALARAQQGVEVAGLEHGQAIQEVAQARAEVAMARGDLQEAEAMRDAAVQGRASAQADLDAATSEVGSMRAALTSAEADRDYMRAEFARMQELFDKGAISRDEFQKSQSEVAKAEAMVSQSRQEVAKASAMVRAAQAMQRKTEAEIVAAGRKVSQARAGVRAKEAMVRTAQAGAAAARARIGQEQSMVRESSAGLSGAAAQRSYAQIVATIDGVVTARSVSPGTVVSPGQTLLKVAQVSPIRLQANVPAADLSRIKVGAPALVAAEGGAEVAAKVSSVSPSMDPGSRTGIVEVILPNSDRRFRPGQYLTLRLTVSESSEAIVLPHSTLVQSGTESSVWVAERGGNDGEYTVKRQQVTLGARDGVSVEVVTGLTEGQQVVENPSPDLRDGMRVLFGQAVAQSEGPTIRVTDEGFTPESIEVPTGKPIRITFIRTTDQTCGTEAIFRELKIEKKLPLDEPVVVEIPAQPAGVLNYECAMSMLKGRVIVK